MQVKRADGLPIETYSRKGSRPEHTTESESQMRTKLLVVAASVAVIAASLAVGAGAKGKPPTTGSTCKPQVSVILRGTLAAAPGAAPTALSVNVTGGNRFAHAYKGAAPVSVTVTSTTKVHRATSTSWADLKSGDRVNIQARACKADLADGKTPPLTATRVTASAQTS
jgi:hypothetical protein